MSSVISEMSNDDLDNIYKQAKINASYPLHNILEWNLNNLIKGIKTHVVYEPPAGGVSASFSFLDESGTNHKWNGIYNGTKVGVQIVFFFFELAVKELTKKGILSEDFEKPFEYNAEPPIDLSKNCIQNGNGQIQQEIVSFFPGSVIKTQQFIESKKLPQPKLIEENVELKQEVLNLRNGLKSALDSNKEMQESNLELKRMMQQILLAQSNNVQPVKKKIVSKKKQVVEDNENLPIPIDTPKVKTQRKKKVTDNDLKEVIDSATVEQVSE